MSEFLVLSLHCISLGPDPKPELHGDNRTYRVWLDPNQYQMDMTQTVKGEEVSRVLNIYL